MAVGNAVIGALRVNLGLDSAQFSQGLKQSQGSLQNFAKAAAIGFAAVTAAAAGAFAQIQQAAERADNAWKASQSLGVPIRDLGRLEHAAKMSGASFETLSTGLRRGSQAIAQAVSGASNEATRALDRLGISAKNTDGSARGMADVMGDVAEQFSKMPDGVDKTNAAIALFGRSGAALIPMLNAGRDGLQGMGDEAERLGLVFNERTALASEVFNDNLARLSGSLTGLWNRVLANVIPAFADLSSRFVQASQEGGVLDGIVVGISAAMNLLTRAVGFAFDNLGHLYDLMKVFVAAKTVLFIGSMAGAFVSLAKAVRTAGLAMALVSNLSRMKITTFAVLAAVVAKLTGTYDQLVGALSNVGQWAMSILPEGVQQGIDGITGSLQELAFGIEGVDQSVATSMGRYLTAADMAANSFGPLIDTMGQIGDATEEMGRRGVYGWELWGNAAASARAEVADAVFGLATSVTGALGAMFDDTKAFAVAEIVISTAQGIMKALAQQGPLGWINAAAIGAAGAAQLATVMKSQPGSASAPTVNRGVATPSAMAPSAPTAARDQRSMNFTFQGQGGISRDQFREFVEAANEWGGDGMRFTFSER